MKLLMTCILLLSSFNLFARYEFNQKCMNEIGQLFESSSSYHLRDEDFADIYDPSYVGRNTFHIKYIVANPGEKTGRMIITFKNLKKDVAGKTTVISCSQSDFWLVDIIEEHDEDDDWDKILD